MVWVALGLAVPCSGGAPSEAENVDPRMEAEYLVTLKAEKMPLKEVLKRIRKQAAQDVRIAKVIHKYKAAVDAIKGTPKIKFPPTRVLTVNAKIEPGNPDDPLLRQILPLPDELTACDGFSADPVDEAAATRLWELSERAVKLARPALT